MGKRLNIGIYIGPNDLDIAAWLNMLQDNGFSRATWIRGLLCAYSLDRPLMIGCISTTPQEQDKQEPRRTMSSSPLLFGVGDSQTPRKEKYKYGWQVRGPNREFIVGSVANVSISKNEILPILDEVWENGHAVATFVKSLIRKNLTYASTDIPPSVDELQATFTDFNIRQAKVKIPERRKKEQNKQESAKPKEQTDPAQILAETKEWPQQEKKKNPLLNLV